MPYGSGDFTNAQAFAMGQVLIVFDDGMLCSASCHGSTGMTVKANRMANAAQAVAEVDMNGSLPRGKPVSIVCLKRPTAARDMPMSHRHVVTSRKSGIESRKCDFGAKRDRSLFGLAK